MISTYLGYQLYGQNLAQTLKQTAAQPAVSQAEQYYNANIGNVKTVSDLVNNFRLLSYVTQAFGLGSMTYAKGLLTSVFESNLSDSTSVANQLGGNYVKLAQAFNFNSNGTIAATTQLQSSAQQSGTEASFTLTSSQSSTASSTASSNYASAMSSITSLQGLESNSTTLNYALAAYGVDSTTPAATLTQTLESNLASSTSFVNEQADSGYTALWEGFSINSDGSASTVSEAETQPNIQATTEAYESHVGTASTSQANGAAATSYFLAHIGNISSATQLVSDPQIVSYLENAYQLPSTTTTANIVSALTSDLTDKSSYANSSPFPGFLQMAKAFNFDTSGNAGTVTQVQTANQQQSTVNLYMEHQTNDSAAADSATAYYKANIGSITSVSQLEQNSQLLNYVETAYGIGSSTSQATLQSIIENTNGIATSSPNAGLLALNQAYNVDSNGNVTAPYAAQSVANISATATAYFNNAGTTAAQVAAAKTATGYYESTIPNVTSAGNLLADPKLVAYLEQAYDIPTTTTTATLKQVLTSNLSDPSSIANTMGNNYANLAASFNFGTNGLITKEPGNVQTRAQLTSVNNNYLDQQIETTAGNQNPGIALALYLQFQAPNITNAYSILGDSKLVTIFQTMMGQSSSASQANIDVQAAEINSAFDLSKLKDPSYLKTLIQRFSIMYDLNPPTNTGTYTATSVLSGSTSSTPLDETSLFSSTKKSTAQLLFGSNSTNSTSASSSTDSNAYNSTSVLFG